ncbi:hypothetical protein MSAN_02529300 [Mycena sanguinolenta]|uniref:Uncharacterized protein n=1 Tax=Mycena sanguinolenta TaxID=230812 RepID=A0A8H6TWD9_9AGAR|nr:hypothetical protein MSAN_02529300 [Mycena sanguinolenta]
MTSRSRLGAFFTASDSIVNEHLRERFPNEVHIDVSLLLHLWMQTMIERGILAAHRHRLPVSAVVSSFWFIHFDVVDEDVQFYANLIFLNELKVIAASSRGPYSVKPMCQYIKFVVLRLFIDPDNNSTANPMDTISSQASTLLIPLQGRCLKY